MINRQQLKKLNDNKLLKLTKRVYGLSEEGKVSEKALHYFIEEVSGRKYGFEDVMETTWVLEWLCFTNDGNELVKMVKYETARKFLKNGVVGDVILPVSQIKSIWDDDKGNLLII